MWTTSLKLSHESRRLVSANRVPSKNSISLKAQVRCLTNREEIMSCGDAKRLKSIPLAL